MVTRGDEVPAGAVPEVVEDAVAVALEHLGVDVEAGEAELRDLLREELHAVHRVAEDDRLVDLELFLGFGGRRGGSDWGAPGEGGKSKAGAFQGWGADLGEEGVEAVELLALLDKGVVLRDTLESELLHQVDDVGLLQELVLELLDRDGEGGRVEEDLALRVREADELLDDGLELGRQELVGLVHHEDVAVVELGHLLVREVEDAAGGRDDDVDGVVEAHDIVLERGAAGRHHHLDTDVLPDLLDDLRRLEGQFSRGDEEHRCGEGEGKAQGSIKGGGRVSSGNQAAGLKP